jgi:PAS domain S-box-containing protein
MTDSEQLEKTLKECEEKFLKAFRQSPLALMLTSAQDHRYIDVNETFERITSWKRDDVIGRTPFDLGIWVNPNQRVDLVKTLLSGGTVRNLEFRVRMKNGEVRTAVGSADLIEINGEPCVLGVAAVSDFKPVPESEQFAMAGRLIQAHDEERAAVARERHDYIDRLSLLSIDLARAPEICSEPVDEVTQVISRARQQIEDLVSDIQILSQRLHSSKLEYLGLATAAADFCKELSDKKSIKIAFASEGISEGLLEKISVCLFHVLQEALQIASDRSASEAFEVSLSVESNDIHLIVRDSEIGFDPGEALEESRVGLTIMRERLNIVGGKLWIESPGKPGTTIHARVPINPN